MPTHHHHPSPLLSFNRALPLLLALLLVLPLSGCGAISQLFCEHEFAEATCTEPPTCTKCGKTDGEALGHDWIDATCGDPKTCERCGETEGEPTGDHTWVEATCEKPKTCSVCGATAGEKLPHDWQPATCTEPETCSVCGATKGQPLGHDWIDATYEEPKTCAVCGETSGKPLERPITDLFPVGESRIGDGCFKFNAGEFEKLLQDFAPDLSVLVLSEANDNDVVHGWISDKADNDIRLLLRVNDAGQVVEICIAIEEGEHTDGSAETKIYDEAVLAAICIANSTDSTSDAQAILDKMVDSKVRPGDKKYTNIDNWTVYSQTSGAGYDQFIVGAEVTFKFSTNG